MALYTLYKAILQTLLINVNAAFYKCMFMVIINNKCVILNIDFLNYTT